MSPPGPCIVERRDFGRDHNPTGVDFIFQHATHQAFAVAVAVREGGIEERDPSVDSLAQRLACLAVFDATPLITPESPAAEAQLAEIGRASCRESVETAV